MERTLNVLQVAENLLVYLVGDRRLQKCKQVCLVDVAVLVGVVENERELFELLDPLPVLQLVRPREPFKQLQVKLRKVEL